MMEQNYNIEKLKYKVAKASKLFEKTGFKIEVNGNFFTIEEYLRSTINLIELELGE